jgi:hypothetical protein
VRISLVEPWSAAVRVVESAAGGCGGASGCRSRSRSRGRGRGTASSESSDLCSQGIDLLLQCGDDLLMLAWGRSGSGSGGRFELVDAALMVVEHGERIGTEGFDCGEQFVGEGLVHFTELGVHVAHAITHRVEGSEYFG